MLKLKKMVAVAAACTITAGCALYQATDPETRRALRAHAASAEDLTFEIRNVGYEPDWSVDVTLPYKETSITYQCAQLKSCNPYASGTLEIPSEYNSVPVKQICYNAFNQCYDLKEIIVPDSVENISSDAFAGCEGLIEIKLSVNLKYVGNRAFYGCKSLQTVSFPKNMNELPTSCFSGCSSLKKINLPESVMRIGNTAFSDCTSLTEITLPQSVTRIGENVFSNCTALESITIANPDCTINDLGYNCKPVIYGEPNSTAEAYAKAHSLEFRPLSEAPPEPENKLPEAPAGSAFCDADLNGEISLSDAQYVLKFYTQQMGGKTPNWVDITRNPNAPV